MKRILPSLGALLGAATLWTAAAVPCGPSPHSAAAARETSASAGTPAPAAVDSVNMWAIDMTVLQVRGRYYAVWSGWDADYGPREGNGQYLYIARMTLHDTAPRVRLGPRVLLTRPELPWELKVREHISLVEGPTALYHGDDVFIVYSTRGSWTDNYKLGMLRLRSPESDPLDPASWIKSPQPVFRGVKPADSLGYVVRGVGHASFVPSPDGSEWWINYHSKTSDTPGWTDRKVFFQRFDFDATGAPCFGVPADPALPMARPAGETAVERADGVTAPEATFRNPVYDGADPWIVRHGGRYYTCRSIDRGIWVTESRFMTRFEGGVPYREARRKVWTPPAYATDRWNIRQIWAPELHFLEGKWYIFYAAGKQTGAPYWQQRAGVLVSENGPFGPYVEHDVRPLFTGEVRPAAGGGR